MQCEGCECEIATYKIMIQRIPREDHTEGEINLCKKCAEEKSTWEWLLEHIDNKYIWDHYNAQATE